MHENINAILKKHLGSSCALKNIIPLTGGMVNRVFLIETTEPHQKLVLKYSEKENRGFEYEYKSLDTLNRRYNFPVPEPYFYSNYDSDTDCAYLGMEYWNAVNMGISCLSSDDREIIEKEIAETIAKLHCYTEERYYTLFSDEKYDKLYQIMYKKYKENMNPEVESKIGHDYYKILLRIVERLDRVFIENERPVLVHGDIWSTNVMLENREDVYHLKGFIDPSPHFINREYELSYLQVFGMFSNKLFKYYKKFHRIDEGFEIRRYFYWLHTMLVHVNYFGDLAYVLRAKKLISLCDRFLQ